MRNQGTKRHSRGAPLGQHFLTRPEIAGWVADALPITPQDTVLEIGPGHGILTRALLARADTIYTIEKDVELARELRETFANEILTGRLVVIEEDVRNFDPTTSLPNAPYIIVANIPYYITGYIIRKFLTTHHHPQAMALLMQKEVATRIVAQDKKESLLSLSVKIFGIPSIANIVRAGAFSPPPKVDSAILRITHINHASVPKNGDIEHLFTLLHKAFGEKRKQLKHTLKDIPEDVFTSCQIDSRSRPEDVSLEKWLCLSSHIINPQVIR